MFRFVFMCLLLATGPRFLAANPQHTPADLIEWIRDAKKAGLKPEQIQQNAVNAGWAPAMVQQAIDSEANNSSSRKPAAADPSETAGASKTTAENGTASVKPAEDVKLPPAETKTAPIVESREGSTASESGTSSAIAPPAIAPPAGAGAPKAPTSDSTLRYEYRIGEGDVLQISVWGEREASVPNVVVRPDGMISMPLIKDVQVAGLTPAEAEKTITEAAFQADPGRRCNRDR